MNCVLCEVRNKVLAFRGLKTVDIFLVDIVTNPELHIRSSGASKCCIVYSSARPELWIRMRQ